RKGIAAARADTRYPRHGLFRHAQSTTRWCGGHYYTVCLSADSTVTSIEAAATPRGMAQRGDSEAHGQGGEEAMIMDDEAPAYNAGLLRDTTAASPAAPSTVARVSPQNRQVQFSRSEAEMLRMKEELLNLELPRIDDGAEEESGEATWRNACEMVKGVVGYDGYRLQRRNKLKLYSGTAAGNRPLRNRWRTVLIVCDQGGKPDRRSRVVQNSPKDTTSKKLGCKFQVMLNWPAQKQAPVISTACSCRSLLYVVELALEKEDDTTPPYRG
ncbi:unnamed protein product, partial [Ectocarpus sp. 6 AP-2014]